MNLKVFKMYKHFTGKQAFTIPWETDGGFHGVNDALSINYLAKISMQTRGNT